MHTQVPSALSNELKLPSENRTKRLDELVRDECNGDFHLKKYISKKTEQFLQVKRKNQSFSIYSILNFLAFITNKI